MSFLSRVIESWRNWPIPNTNLPPAPDTPQGVHFMIEPELTEPSELSWTLRPFRSGRGVYVDPTTKVDGDAIFFASNTEKGTYLCFGGNLLRFDEKVWGKHETIVDRASPYLILRNWYVLPV